MQPRDKSFLPLTNRYEGLTVYKVATCIYAITYYFAQTYLPKGDRTVDQMIQAARSGKQNIAEGMVDGEHPKRCYSNCSMWRGVACMS